MSELSIGNQLKLLAGAQAQEAAPWPPLEGLAALLELGQLAEANPDAAGFAVAELSTAEAQTLLQWAQGERQQDVAFLYRQLQAVEDHADLLELPPVLADDPDAAEAAQGQALAALHTRERIHRLGVVATWLHSEGEAVGGQGAEMAKVDQRLRDMVAALAVLAPERARMAAQVAPQDQPAHWWWTAPSPQVAELEPTAEDSAAVAQLQQWVTQRIVGTPGDSQLQLSPDESAALLSTPKGQRLAAYLGDRLDLALPQAVTYQGTVGELLIGGAAPSLRSGRPHGQLLELWPRQPVGRPERLAAATALDQPVLRGLDALAGVFCTAAELLPGIGVVAHGTRAFDGGRQRVWLFVPELEVASLQIAGAGEPWLAELWSPGGLAIAAAAVDEPFEVTATRGVGGDSPAIHQILEAGPAEPQPNLLTRLLRHVHDEQRDAARSDWAELEASCDGELGQALSGLRLALTKLFGEAWS